MKKMMMLASLSLVTAMASGPSEPNVHLNISHFGDTVVSGRVQNHGKHAVMQITRTHPDGHADQIKVVSDENGAFTGTLPGSDKLAAGDKVTATVVPIPASNDSANPAAPPPDPAAPPANPATLPKVVTVLASTPPIIRFEKAIDQTRGSMINVDIAAAKSAAWPAALLGKQTVTVVADDAIQLAGDVALPNPPDAPDASTLSVALVPATTPEDSDTITIEDALCEWGRVRCYAYFGVIFSQENSDLSKTDPYLDFSLEWNWVKTRHSILTGFFDTRLTEIPAPDPAVATAAAPQGEGNATGQAAATTAQTAAADAFATSAKSPQVMGGAYWAPYVPDRFVWDYQGQKYGVFPALIYKGGVQGRIDGALDPSNLAFPNQGKSVFTFNAAGVRLGFVKWYTDDARDPHKSEAHDLLSYIDFTVGKYRLYDFVGPDFGSPTGVPGGGLSDVRHYGLRKVFEGRLKIPHANIQLGFDANLGQGQNDLRFSVTTNGIDLIKTLLGMN